MGKCYLQREMSATSSPSWFCSSSHGLGLCPASPCLLAQRFLNCFSPPAPATSQYWFHMRPVQRILPAPAWQSGAGPSFIFKEDEWFITSKLTSFIGSGPIKRSSRAQTYNTKNTHRLQLPGENNMIVRKQSMRVKDNSPGHRWPEASTAHSIQQVQVKSVFDKTIKLGS